MNKGEGIMKVLILLCLALPFNQTYSQCILSATTDRESEVISCLTTCGCTEIIVPDGVTINMDGDWDLTGEGAVTLTIQGNGGLVFSGAGGGRDELFLASGSVLIIEDTGNSNALSSSPPSGGNTRVEIGSTVYVGNDFDDIIAAGGADENGVLPITLSYFHAQVDGAQQSVNIRWQTSSEINNDYFTVERSVDGLSYESLSIIDGAGNSDGLIDYQFIDYSPVFGRSYYRLTQTDFDGASETFKPVSVLFSTLDNDIDFKIIPNPANSEDVIKIFTGASDEEQLGIQVYNSKGKLVYHSKIAGFQTAFKLGQELGSGLYVVNVFSPSGSQKSTKLLIQ